MPAGASAHADVNQLLKRSVRQMQQEGVVRQAGMQASCCSMMRRQA